MKKKTRKKVVVFVRYTTMIACAAILVAIILFFTNNKNENYVHPAPVVEIMKPAQRSISQSITLSGHIEALTSVPVVPLVSGIITYYPIKIGMPVSEGEILAIIDKAPFELQVLEAKAAYENYTSTFKRVEKLYKVNAATLQNFQAVKAQRDSAKAQLELAKLQLGYAEVSAPVEGTILTAPLAKGSVGTPQQPVAVIADLREQVVRLNIPEKYFDLFNTNPEKLSANITRADMTTFSEPVSGTAVIDTIAPYIQIESKTFQTVFTLTENLNQFRPGMFVEVTVSFNKHENILALPLSVLKLDGSCYIFTPDEIGEKGDPKKGTVTWHQFPVTVKDNNYFMVPEKLSDKWFVTAGQSTVFDRQTVTVAENHEEEASDKELMQL